MKNLVQRLSWGVLLLFIMACAWKSGFDGEQSVSVGSVSAVYCGEAASTAPLVPGRIVLARDGLNASLFEDRDRLAESIDSSGRCNVVDKLPEVMEEGVAYFRFLTQKVEIRQPFGSVVRVNGKLHVTDTTSCWSLAGAARLDRTEGFDTLSFRLNARRPFFDEEALSYFRDLCASR